jgi:hypothetical protein
MDIVGQISHHINDLVLLGKNIQSKLTSIRSIDDPRRLTQVVHTL